ncbi:MAG: HNH endonuclease [Brevundimonas sp.]
MHRPICGFEALYTVGPDGSVFALPRQAKGGRGIRNLPGRFLTPKVRSRYLCLTLCGDGGSRTNVLVHRVVCAAFNGPAPFAEAQVNHRDGNRLNNHFSNLEWVSRSENLRHAYDNDLKPAGEKSHLAKLTADQVREIRAMRGLKSQAEIGRQFGVSQTCVGKILSGKKWKQLL